MSIQLWIEAQIDLGLIDIEKTPEGFNRASYNLKKLEKESTLGTTCFYCSKPLTAKRVTSDHVRWYCNELCMQTYFYEEEQALRTKEHD